MNKQLPYKHAFELDGAREVDWEQSKAWTPKQGDLWLHLDRTSEPSQVWLHKDSGLPEHVVDGLLASNSRPRLEAVNGGLLLTLRGVNLNENAEPSEMISLRIWI